MNEGDIIRFRNVRDYGTDGRSWVETSLAKRGEKPADKIVGVALLLGAESLALSDEDRANYAERIDAMLHAIGLMSIDDAVAAGADPARFKFKLRPAQPKETDDS